MKFRHLALAFGLALSVLASCSAEQTSQHRDHLGDDVGQSNVSAYSHGVMGYKTPNIDRLARE